MRPLLIGTAVLKNRELRIKMSKAPRNEDDNPITEEIINPESAKLIEETGRKLIKHFAVTVVTVVVVIKAIDTLSEIAVKKTKSADNE